MYSGVYTPNRPIHRENSEMMYSYRSTYSQVLSITSFFCLTCALIGNAVDDNSLCHVREVKIKAVLYHTRQRTCDWHGIWEAGGGRWSWGCALQFHAVSCAQHLLLVILNLKYQSTWHDNSKGLKLSCWCTRNTTLRSIIVKAKKAPLNTINTAPMTPEYSTSYYKVPQMSREPLRMLCRTVLL